MSTPTPAATPPSSEKPPTSVTTPQVVPTRAQPPANTAPTASRSPAATIGFLGGHLLLDFGRLDSTYRRINVTMSIDNQNTVARAVYRQMEQLCSVALLINEVNFIRMWKTLILKRVQDIYEQEKHTHAENFIRVMRNLPIPAPLADLLYALGQLHSRALGTIYDLVPPAKPAQAEPWWTLDQDILSQWCLTLSRMSHQYMMKEFPSPVEYKDRALVMTAIHDVPLTHMRSVRAYTNEPTAADGFLRFVNDDLFTNARPYDQCDLRIVEGLERLSILQTYAGSYVLMSNS